MVLQINKNHFQKYTCIINSLYNLFYAFITLENRIKYDK